MKPKPDGGKKKSAGSPDAAAQRQVRTLYAKAVATGSRDASTKKQMGKVGMAKLGSSLRAEDVKGKGRSAAAGRRVDAIKKLGAGNRKAANTGRPKSLPKTM
jgi:hypothetical protein